MNAVTGNKVQGRSLTSLRSMVDQQDIASATQTSLDRRGRVLDEAIITTKDQDRIISEIKDAWSRAQTNFLTCGHYLCQSRTLFEREVEEDASIKAVDRESEIAKRFRERTLSRLPFSASIASQLQKVASAVFFEKRLLQSELPNSYSVAYQLVTLPPDRLEHARQSGISLRTMTRKAVIDLKQSRPDELEEPAVAQDSQEHLALSERRLRVIARINRLQRELESIDNRLMPRVKPDA